MKNPESVLLLFCFTFWPLVLGAREGPPNIVLIMADDVGYECFSANGGTSYSTPHFDRLADQGVRFENCFANPICTPSRVKIMTGQYNVRNYTRFGELERSQRTFAHLFKEAGYRTFIAGKWQLGREKDAPRHFGFEEALLWQHTRGRTRDGQPFDSRHANPRLEHNGEPVDYDNGEFGPQVLADAVCAFIRENRDNPFLVYYPMVLPHCPWVPTPDSQEYHPTRPGSETYYGDAAFFGGMVTYLDTLLGQVVRQLDELGLRENTMVLFTGDNGTDRPIVSRWKGREVTGGKGTMTDAGTRVPLVASLPGRIQPGVNEEELVDFADVLPTLCDAAGIALPAGYPGDGVSLWPVLSGSGQRHKPRVFLFFDHQDGGLSLVRTREYALTGMDVEGPFSFFRCDAPYDWKLLDGSNMEPAEHRVHQALLEEARRYLSIWKRR